MNNGSGYPRPLTARERNWLEWLLPNDRKGYRDYRAVLEMLVVIGEGRRGKGNLVLGRSDDVPDLISPLPPVFAYGVIKAEEGTISIMAREEASSQIELEIVPLKGDSVPEEITEKSRWTYSTWSPGNSCPCCAGMLREIRIGKPEDQVVLAICQSDHRLWVYEGASGVNHLIPVTNFFNELMLHKKIREPKIAFDQNYLFIHLHEFSDGDLGYAFVVYNKIRRKVESTISAPVLKTRRKPFTQFMMRMFHHSE